MSRNSVSLLASLFMLGAGAAGAAENPSTVTVRGAVFELVRIPSGEFQMGSDRDLEKPRHRVRVRSFDLAKTEVTVGQFRAFTEATGYKTDAERENWTFVCCWSKPDGSPWQSRGYWMRGEGTTWRALRFTQSDNDPVVALSWQDAVEFCKWLSAETKQDFRLPSEAEWEYAARAGAGSEIPAELDEVAWHRGNSDDRTHPVARKKPNAWGIYDMLGNAWEWTADVWSSDYTGAPEDGSARLDGGNAGQGFKAGDGRALRGGAWGLEREAARFAVRPPFPIHARCNNSGFRIARTAVGGYR